jgi:hypothetical protein
MNTIIAALLIILVTGIVVFTLYSFDFVKLGGNLWKASFFIEAKGKTRKKG